MCREILPKTKCISVNWLYLTWYLVLQVFLCQNVVNAVNADGYLNCLQTNAGMWFKRRHKVGTRWLRKIFTLLHFLYTLHFFAVHLIWNDKNRYREGDNLLVTPTKLQEFSAEMGEPAARTNISAACFYGGVDTQKLFWVNASALLITWPVIIPIVKHADSLMPWGTSQQLGTGHQCAKDDGSQIHTAPK